MNLKKFDRDIRQLAREAMQAGDAIYNGMDPSNRAEGLVSEKAETLYSVSKLLYTASEKIFGHIMEHGEA